MRKTPKNERELTALLRDHIAQSALLEDSEIARQRVRAIDAYHGRNHRNRPELSNHVSRDVFDVVESEKALLLQTFSGARKIIRFRPRDPDDVEAAKLRNAYLNHLFWEKNKGYQLLYDGIHNAEVEKVAAYKYWWDSDSHIEKRPFQGNAVMLQAARFEMTQQGWQLAALEQTGPDQFVGEFVRIIDQSQVRIRTIAPDCLRVDPGADSIDNAVFVGEEIDLTGSELVALGVDAAILETLNKAGASSTVGNARKRHDNSQRLRDHAELTPAQQKYTVVDCYIRLDIDDDGISELYQVWAGLEGELLTEPEPVPEVPIVADSLIPLPHKFHGLAPAETLVDIQETNSDIKRQMVDHLARVNSQRMVGDLQVIRNPMDLIENHVGSVIDAPFLNGHAPLQPLQQTQLSPATTAILEEMKQEKEFRGGISRVAQGLNQDAISNQNADSLIERYTSASTRRTMMKARNFAELILKPLLQGVYRLAVEMDNTPVMLQVGGQWQQVSPQQLGRDAELAVDMAVTDEEASRRAQTLMLIHNTLINSKSADVLYPEKRQHALLTDVLEMTGESAHLYLEDPNNPKAQQSIVGLQQQLAQVSQQLQLVQQQNQQLAHNNRLLQVQVVNRQADARAKLETEARKAGQKDRELDIREDAEEHKQAVDMAELAIEKQQQRPVDV